MSAISINLYGLSHAAQEFYGRDVQYFWITRERGAGARTYTLHQMTHRLGARQAACVTAHTAEEARAKFSALVEEVSQ